MAIRFSLLLARRLRLISTLLSLSYGIRGYLSSIPVAKARRQDEHFNHTGIRTRSTPTSRQAVKLREPPDINEKRHRPSYRVSLLCHFVRCNTSLHSAVHQPKIRTR